MEQKVKRILLDIYAIAPELQEREEELKKTVKKLLSSKPETELDPGFKQELLDKILQKYGKQPQGKRFWLRRPMFITATAASLVVLVLGIIYILPEKVELKPKTIIQDTDQSPVKPVSRVDKPAVTDPKTGNSKETATVQTKKEAVKSTTSTQTKKMPVQIMPKITHKITGDLQVTVKTADGSPIPGALAKIAGKDGQKRISITNEQGQATFKNLPPGKVDVTCELEGFNTTHVLDVKVAENYTSSREVVLGLGAISQEVVVSGEAAVVDARSSVVANKILDPNALSKVATGDVISKLRQLGYVTPSGSRQAKGEERSKSNWKMPSRLPNTESYDYIAENRFQDALKSPLSTFSIDVDTASYANVRRFLFDRQRPPLDAVRLEELINYFPYDYPLPKGRQAFSIHTEVSQCPWNPKHHLVLVGLKGKDLKEDEIPPSNLVFLLDVSGSMDDAKKLPLLKDSFKLLTHELRREDRVAIVVYAGSAGMVLPSTPGTRKTDIIRALRKLRAGGSTAGGEGINLAYAIAEKNFIKGGNNRVILATDGDFNVGPSSDAAMVRLIEEKRKKGIFLTVMGFGMGNYKDSKMEKLADQGNGNYFYIDSLMEANKVLVHDLRKTLFTIAKDVKIQIEFNPAKVESYRLLGYENRILNKEDFADDTKDAGEIGAGHTVTALYEILPRAKSEVLLTRDELKYQQSEIKARAFRIKEIMTIKVRYKRPDKDKSTLVEEAVKMIVTPLEKTSDNFRFASAVAEFGLLLRNSRFKGEASFASLLERAQSALAADKYGYRREFIKLVKIAEDVVEK